MTWGEFKARVEAAGAHDSDEIDMIDIVRNWPIEIIRELSQESMRMELVICHADDGL